MAFNTIKTAVLTTAIALGAGVMLIGAPMSANASGGEGAHELKHVHWHFKGLRGTYDREAMQRGYQVYKEVCSSCHALEHLDFRHLGDKGAPFYDEHYPNPNDNPLIKAFAAEWEIPDIDGDNGDAITRKGIPADSFPNIYANPIAAAASNGGAVPPDLSLITSARNNGPDYVYNLLTSYGLEAPHGVKVGAGQSYNPVMDGGLIAMAAPLTADMVEYEGEHAPAASVDQMALDVVEFLAWSADPKMEQRKRAGFATMLYLFLLSILLFFSYKKVWGSVKH
ncbi:MAG: cytochrome c1 [Robiginitomaculum sp.]